MSGNDLVMLAQGAGKSHIIAEYAKAINEPVLILQPTEELVRQNVEKLEGVVSKEEIGVFSASLNSQEIKTYTFATIGSIVNKSDQFNHFKTVIIDECHLVSPKATGSMFMRFLKAIGNPKVVGLTASPFRQCQSYIRYDNGWFDTITTTKMINRTLPLFWNRLLYTISTQQLIDQEYLVPLTYVDKRLIDQSQIPVNRSKSDFDLKSFEKKTEHQKDQIISALTGLRAKSKSTLVFCSSIEQADELSSLVGGSVVTAKTPKKIRKQIVSDFKAGKENMVYTVQALGTGFDYPGLQVIVLLRPTRSISLYLQLLGRGSRICPEIGKKTCYVIDFTDTVRNLGTIETFSITKIDGKWNLISEKMPNGWHNVELYRYSKEVIK